MALIHNVYKILYDEFGHAYINENKKQLGTYATVGLKVSLSPDKSMIIVEKILENPFVNEVLINPGDRIVEINGKKISDIDNPLNLLKGNPFNNPLSLVLTQGEGNETYSTEAPFVYAEIEENDGFIYRLDGL